ncbi:MAG: recombinase family protein [Lachnospiraceae bacterium]|nr:recombinase family protein [Lachnospiraceae bacterium]
MLKLTLDRAYKAAIYLRLSKEDGDFSFSGEKLESDSISNQRLLILEYLKKCPEITVVKEYCDDGYTGANFERPQFQKMMDAVKAGKIDCIVVKDLSRFGREYIDSGNYLQKIFPMLGVRFIAINDNYDNAKPGAAENDIVLSFKNLMNDSYCRDISIKIRTNLDAKRRNGQFVGSRVVYGYMRDPHNKNSLVADRDAAPVVQDIFKWKLEGLSPAKIADKLNDSGILSPIEYKKAKGSKQRTVFQTKPQALWSAVAIYRILKNEIYTGTLLQGKTTTPNHKVKKTMVKDQSEWSRTENAHEAIISAAQFDLVQEIMLDDTRSPVGASCVHPFSGKIFCADCENPMVRRLNRCGDKEYAYFICGGNKGDKHFCSSHRIREEAVYETVLAVIQGHIRAALVMEDAMKCIEGADWEARELKKIEGKIAFQQEIIDKNRRLSTGAYEDFRSQFITREEYETFRKQFNGNIEEAQTAISRLISDRNSIKGGLADQQGWLAQFRQYENIQEITRSVVVNLIDRICIRDNKDIDVQLKHQDQFAAIVEFLNEERAKEESEKIIIMKREAV